MIAVHRESAISNQLIRLGILYYTSPSPHNLHWEIFVHTGVCAYWCLCILVFVCTGVCAYWCLCALVFGFFKIMVQP